MADSVAMFSCHYVNNAYYKNSVNSKRYLPGIYAIWAFLPMPSSGQWCCMMSGDDASIVVHFLCDPSRDDNDLLWIPK